MSLIRREFIWNVQRVLLAVLLIVALATIGVGVRLFVRVRQVVNQTPTPTGTPALESVPTAAPDGPTAPPRPPDPTLSPEPLPTSVSSDAPTGLTRIGIVAGHWQNDSGAVCPDGLSEVDINREIAERVVMRLRQEGYEAEMLAEFSARLDGYQAAALVSIHADSCNVPEASGFKVARVSSSMVPALEDRLVACLSEHYARATGLSFHRNSITFDMTEYHAFYEIDPQTPAAIIEIGFMDADRRLLTRRQERVEQGIVDGLLCFLAP